MNKLSISIDLLALQGAHRMTSASGKDVLVIDLAESRSKPHKNGKVYLNLDAVENRKGEDDYGNSHFVCEPVSKQEREEGLRLPIIGNAKEFGDSKGARDTRPPPARRNNQEDTSGFQTPAAGDDDIPF